jgi:hypothetical protein
VGNSPRVVLGGGGAQKIVHDGETFTSNSGDEASLLHGSSGFVSPSYGGGTSPSCSASSQRDSGGDIAVWWRRRLWKGGLLGYCGPKRSQGGGLYRGILRCADRLGLGPTPN